MNGKGHPTAERYPGVPFRDIGSNKVEGYLSKVQLAAILETGGNTLAEYILHQKIILPDFYTRKGIFFSEDRIEEIKRTWENRKSAFPASGCVKAVITPYGMMLPRVTPRKEVLERLSLSTPKRRSRDSSWKTRRHYNLEDL